jgi:hypothetical protein
MSSSSSSSTSSSSTSSSTTSSSTSLTSPPPGWIGDLGVAVYQHIYRVSDTYLERPDEAGTSITGGFTTGAWVWFSPGSSGLEMGIVSKWLGNERQFVLRKTSTNSFDFSVSGDGTAVISINDASISFKEEIWYYIVGRYTPSTEIALFINGNWYKKSDGIPASLHDSTQAFEFCRYNADNYLDGHITHGFLSAEAVEDSVVEANYSHTKAMFMSQQYSLSSTSSSSSSSTSSTTSSSSSSSPFAVDVIYLRNGYLKDVEMFNSRTLTPLAGNTNVIFDTDREGVSITNFVSANNYIYFFYYGSDDWFHLVEYDKNTTLDIDLSICSGPVFGSVGGGIAYIEGRKILAVSDNNDDYTGVFIVNFDDSTISRPFEMDYPITVRSITLSGHIWLYTFGYYSTGWDIWRKDYTINSAWAQVFIDANNDNVLNNNYPFFVDDDYLVWFVSKVNVNAPFNPVVKAFAYKLSDNTSQYSSWVGPDDYYNRSSDIQSASQGVDSCAYATASGWSQTSFPPFEYFDCWYKYNPSTNTLTLIHTEDFIDTYSEGFPHSMVFSSSYTTYIWDWINETFVKITGSGGSGVGYLRSNFINSSLLMDNNYERALICGNDKLHIFSATGNTGQDVNITDAVQSHHLKNLIIVTADSGGYWKIYTVL